MNVSHPFVVQRFVEPALEAMALNRKQRDLVFDPSEEPDSILEHLLNVRPDDAGEVEHLRAAARLSLRLARLNDGEFTHVRLISGTADRLARDAHAAERDGARESLKAKAVANRIRPHLQVLDKPREHTPREFLAAAWAVGDLFRELPADALFTPALEHELGKGRVAQLRELYEQRVGARA